MSDSEVLVAVPAAEVQSAVVEQGPSTGASGSGQAESLQVSSVSSKREEVSLSAKSDDAEFLSRSGRSRIDDLDIDKDYTTRLLSTSGGFTSSVRENILSHPVVLKNRSETSVPTYVSTESRQVMRKGFDIGIASPGLRMLYDARIKELEEELEAERASRTKIDKHRSELQREIQLLNEKLEETAEHIQQQVDLNRKREGDFLKLQRELEDSHIQNESLQVSFRKKHQDGINQLQEQIEQLQKMKQKVEKEKNLHKAEAEDLRNQVDHVTKGKASTEKLVKQFEAQVVDLNQKFSEVHKEVQEGQNAKARLVVENSELHRRLEETEAVVQQLNKAKQTQAKQLDEMKVALDDETTVRSKVLSDNRNLQAHIDQLREQLEEEQEARAELQRQVTKAAAESAAWRQKFESGEGNIRPEEVEELKRKFIARIQDVEAQLEATVGKIITVEKAKNRIQSEMESLASENEKLQAINSGNDKRQRQFDKLIDEWKKKVSDVQLELENAQKEARLNASEIYKSRAQLEETQEVIEGLRRENKNLSDEIHDLTDQIAQVNHRMAEVDKAAKRFESEREELQSTLEEAEAALEQEEAKVQRAQMEVTAAREELERRLAEKEEEFEGVRKNHQRALDAMQLSLEAEVRNKMDALRMKKKLEQDINDLEVALDGMNKAKAEVEKNYKKYQQQIRDLQQLVDDEQRLRHGAREELGASERRSALLAGEIEELRIQVELLERNRKSFEAEMHDAAERISEVTSANASLLAAKKKLEADIQALHGDFEEQLNAVKVSEEQAKKAMVDASRIAEELRQEQDHAGQIEKLRRGLEVQVKELQLRLDEAEAAALQGGKKMIQKLEQRVREVEVELEAEQHRHAETQKGLRKQDRRMQELTLQVDEDRKIQERLHDAAEKLQQKINNYKRQVEEAEEIAAINLAKYRKIQHDLEESEARADMAETMVNQLRSKTRGASITVSESISQPFAGVTVKSTTRTQNISLDSKRFDS